ncbi:MAG: hypothetical protein OZ917_06040 [Candidatus Brocadiaceae bacterium]|nr:hypothetical protein [Candidatus Brocadiaceae bacterium]
MRQINYLVLICILISSGSGRLFALDTGNGDVGKDFLPVSTLEEEEREETSENTKEIRIRKDEFDEIVGQLQGMKELLVNMKQDYDNRFKEMQDKIAILEKEKTMLEKEKISLEEDKLTVAKAGTKTPETFVSEEPVLPQAATSTIPPSAPQTMSLPPKGAIAETTSPPANTTATDQPAGLQSGAWSPAQPITLWSAGPSYMKISFDALFAAAGSTAKDLESLETGGHDPNQRGFTAQNLETVFEGAVDPYFYGLGDVVFQIDKDGKSFLEVEEAYLTSMSLPLNLQVKAGTFFTEFGRLNPTHPHTWNFADQPLVNGRFLGPDGLRNPGVRISWLAPTDIYTELFFTIQDSQGETAFSFRNPDGKFARAADDPGVRSMDDLLYVPRVATSFDLTDEQTVLLGASAAFGPNSTGRDKSTIIYGLDMFWKWKSKYAELGFPFITWQTEVMGRRFEAGEDIHAGLTDEVLNNWGAYSQIMWGFKKRWVAGFRGDYVDGEEAATDPLGFERWRLSPNLTFYPTEFSKIRLQYNYDDILGNDTTEHSVFLQFEFLLGSHGAHKF